MQLQEITNSTKNVLQSQHLDHLLDEWELKMHEESLMLENMSENDQKLYWQQLNESHGGTILEGIDDF